MKRLSAFVVALLTCGPLGAQPAPFDMTGERPIEDQAPAPKQQEQPSRNGPADGIEGEKIQLAPVKDAASYRRHIVPFASLSLTGEVDERAWSVYLTPAQAAAGGDLIFEYQNAVVIAPESSVLSVFVNGKLVGEGPVQAGEKPESRRYKLPSNLLRTGSNEIRFRVQQRHRTDCTVESTYELWTEIASGKAYIQFEGRDAARLTTLEDIQAVGVDASGRTRFNIVAPAFDQPSRTAALMRLAQGLALLGHMPAQSFDVRGDLPELGRAGELTVLAGTVAELQPLFPSLPGEASTTAVTALVESRPERAPILVLTGPDWSAVEGAIESITRVTDKPANVARDVIETGRWRLPQAPQVISGKRLPFSALGVSTTEFSGRRFRTAFAVAVPPDFYANAYGEATVLLDVGYTKAVRPGSRIDIYVNGSIASTVPLDSSGGLVRHLPINVTLRHFHPGANLIELEAVLLTDADRTCAPGTAASTEPRFALFDTSEFAMADFARIGRLPDLAAAAGSAYPFRSSAKPIALHVDRAETLSLSAAATFLARLAVAGGRPMAIETITSPIASADREALFVGAMPQIPKSVLTEAGIDLNSQISWGSSASSEVLADSRAAFDAWQTRLNGGTWRSHLRGLEDWVKDTFDISLNSLRFLPPDEAPFAPPDTATLLIAQSSNPDAGTTWTLVTSPTPEHLRDAVSTISDVRRWSQMSGHISIYEPVNDRISSIPAQHFEFVETRPPSLANYRLVLANWLSSNILVYAVLLVCLVVLLGLATASLLARLGRRQ